MNKALEEIVTEYELSINQVVREREALKQQLAALLARVEELEERLEIGFAYDAMGIRIQVSKDGPDGIECRDATIELQDRAVDELRTKAQSLRIEHAALLARHAKLEEALTAIISEVDDVEKAGHVLNSLTPIRAIAKQALALTPEAPHD